jgi:hypothetical protein
MNVMTKWRYFGVVGGVLSLLALGLAGSGCHAQPAQWSELGDRNSGEEEGLNSGRPINESGLHVVPASGRYVSQLRAIDIVRILRTVGCTNDDIMVVGTDLREALAERGAAQIMVGRRKEATVEVGNMRILITSQTRGAFVYNLQTGQMGLPNASPGQRTQAPVSRR